MRASILPKNTFPNCLSMKMLNLSKNDQNLGFPKAVNQGILEAQGDYILLANNDIIVTEGWLERMVELRNNIQKLEL